ncbi:hypothetical protein GIB67_018284, partial [Kingdonia uniflora]
TKKSRDKVWEQLIGSQRRAVGSTNGNKLGSRSHFLIHTQGCHQMMDEAEKDYKNMPDRIVASVEVMKTSYADFITEVQTSAARGMLILHVFSSHVVDFPKDIGSHFICLHEKATILTILGGLLLSLESEGGQDLTVQRMHNEVTAKVYETHTRLAPEVGNYQSFLQGSQIKNLSSIRYYSRAYHNLNPIMRKELKDVVWGFMLAAYVALSCTPIAIGTYFH